MHRISLLGSGLIGTFYTMALHGHRGQDRVHVAYSRSAERARKFADECQPGAAAKMFPASLSYAITTPTTCY